MLFPFPRQSKHKDLLTKVTARVGAARAAHVLSTPTPMIAEGGARAARTSSWTAGAGWVGPQAIAPASAPPATTGPRISWADGGNGAVPIVAAAAAAAAASPTHVTPVQTPPAVKPMSPTGLRASMSMPIRRRPSMNVALAAAAAAAAAQLATPPQPTRESAAAAERLAPAGAPPLPPSGAHATPASAPRPPSIPGILASGGGAPRRSQSVSAIGINASMAASFPAASSAFNRESAEDRQLLVAFMLHCADLCTPLLPPTLSARATEALGREFAAQAAAERAAGLPVTVMLPDDRASKAKLELGFIEFAVRPLYFTLVGVFPELSSCLSLIDRNRSAWGAVVASEAAADVHTPPRDAGRPKEA